MSPRMSKSALLSTLSNAYSRTPYPHVRPKPQEGGGVAEKNHNLKAASAENFCKTLPHREMNKEYKELFSDFSMNK